jgi:hypothetical protein
MAEPDLKSEGKGVAVLGGFSPAVFHPAWFSDQELIRPDEVDRADVKIVTPDLAVFSLPWIDVQVSQQRFDVITKELVMFEPMRDLVAGTLRLLRGTRFRAIGINHYFHYSTKPMPESLARFARLDSEPAWSQLASPTLTTLVLRAKRPAALAEDQEGFIHVEVQPSVPVSNGTFVLVNDHYDLRTLQADDSADAVERTLVDLWDVSSDYARGVADDIARGITEFANA